MSVMDLHPDIRAFWETDGRTVVENQRDSVALWWLSIDGRNEKPIAISANGINRYSHPIEGRYISEKEMLQLLKLKAFM